MTDQSLSEDRTLSRRRRGLLIVVVVAALSAALGAGIATTIRSPAQVAADTAPPPLTVLSAPVERRQIVDAVPLRGEVIVGNSLAVTPGAPPDGVRPVVTGVQARTGDTLVNGELALEVAGRPAFVLEGQIPMYRDIQPGDHGPDVQQLQAALRLAGLGVYDTEGVFGASTRAALAELYRRAGFDVPLTDAAVPEFGAASDVAEQPGSDGQKKARGSGDRVPQPPPPSPVARASELLFVKTLPARVLATSVDVGSTLGDGPAITLTTEPVMVRAEMNPADAGQIKVGRQAQIVGLTKKAFQGTIVRIGKQQQSQDGGLVVPIDIKPKKPLSFHQVGQQIQIRILRAATDKAALAVPVSAITTSASGNTTVTKLIGKSHEEVQVEVGVSGDGYVQITPKKGSLEPGDRVIVGSRRSGAVQ